jgi:Cu2+-exporting ATPase
MDASHDCFHCGEPVPTGPAITAHIDGVEQPMCCIGCKAVAEFITRSGLEAFYTHRENPDAALGLTPEESDWRPYDSNDLLHRYVHRERDFSEATIDIGGMYCSACVWLFDNSLKRLPGIESTDVNPATRRAVIRWETDQIKFSGLLGAISKVGFKPSPIGVGAESNAADDEYRSSLKRLIVAAAAGMQVMMFAVALYAGDYFGIEGAIEKFLRTISLLVTVPIVFYSARPFFAAAWRGMQARAPGMDLPVSIAILAAFGASTYATWVDRGDIYFDSVAMFVFFLSATRFLEMRARHRSEDHTLAMAQLLPDTAMRIVAGSAETIALDAVRVGDELGIRPGDVVPVDGTILSGSLSVDESMLTGEAVPVERTVNGAVYAGTIIRSGNATIRVTRTGASTSLAEIGRMLERAKADRPPIAVLADRIASRFVLGVLTVTAAAAAYWYAVEPLRAFEIALATLVVTCPCALALATPAAIAAATGRLARSGFLLVRARVLEILNTATVFVFDKTGTLTAGRPAVLETRLIADSGSSAADVLALAAAIESASEHVLARAFEPSFKAGEFEITEAVVVPGYGVEATANQRRYRIGNREFVTEWCQMQDAVDDEAITTVFLADKERLIACFEIGDQLRGDAVQAIAQLQHDGYRTIVASGDKAGVVAEISSRLAVDEWHAGLSPADKLALVHDLRSQGETVVMVGDGINDAPVLAAADASIALDAGTALARASADAVSLGRRLGTVVTATGIAAETRKIIRQNLAWAILYNVTAVPLAVSGFLAPWMAAIGMSASSLVVVLNALRLHRVDIPVPTSAGPETVGGLEHNAAR